MSEELIKKSDAIKHCEVWRDRAKEHKDRDGWWMADNLLGLIKDIPTVEPKRGEWIPYKQDNGKTILWKCSECGRVIYSETETDRLEFNKWCSRCGADMREREGE